MYVSHLIPFIFGHSFTILRGVVHIISGDLILHKRTLEPIKTVVYGLRRYDVDRVAALQEKLEPGVKVEGFMSHKAKIYLVRPLLSLFIM